jgi:tetratricopeptide (TPR) repeat protein
MKNLRLGVLVGVLWLGLLGGWQSPSLALDAYFDVEVSTKLEAQPNSGTVYITRLDEEVEQVLPDIVYEPAIYTEIIFDASKTMDEPDINGIPKIAIAREIATILVNHFPKLDTRFALRVNGAQSANNCLDSQIVVPFQRQNAEQVLAAIKTIRPKGLSPLTYSLRQVLQDFQGTKGTKIVFIITDGQETCDNEPVDTCTTTMDLFAEAEFDGTVHIIGINTINEDARLLMECLTARGHGDFLDSNRDKGTDFAKIIQQAQQLSYSISKVLDPKTLSEGKILELINRRIGDATTLDGDRIVLKPENRSTRSSHALQPGVYKIEFDTVPPLASYFTLDKGQELTIGLVRAGNGIDLYDRAHLALGNKYYDTGDLENAAAEYQKVVDFDPRNVDAHLNLGILYDDLLGNKEKAAEHYKAYLELQGPRQEEVRAWLRKVRGEPSQEEELVVQRQKMAEEKARAEAEQLAAQEAEKHAKERQKILDAYAEVQAANSKIRQIDQQEVLTGDTIHILVYADTTDSDAQNIAIDVGNRLKHLANRTPTKIVVAREDTPDTTIAQATYSDGKYVGGL